MESKKMALLALVFLGFGAGLRAQGPIRAWMDHRQQERRERAQYLVNGASLGLIQVRDYATSPLLFSGPGAGLRFGGEAFSPSSRVVLATDLWFGSLSTRENPDSDTDQNMAVHTLTHWGRLWRATELPWKSQLMLGYAADLLWNARVNQKYGNAAFNYEVLGSLGLSARASRDWSRPDKTVSLWFLDFPLKARRRMLAFELNLPLASASMRPSYVSIFDFTDGDASLGEAALREWGGPGRMFRLNTQLEYYHFFQNGNAIRLAHTWDGYRLNFDLNPVQAVGSFLSFSLLLRLDND